MLSARYKTALGQRNTCGRHVPLAMWQTSDWLQTSRAADAPQTRVISVEGSAAGGKLNHDQRCRCDRDQHPRRPIAGRLDRDATPKAEIMGGHAEAMSSVPGRKRHGAEQDQLSERIVRECCHFFIWQMHHAERQQQPCD